MIKEKPKQTIKVLPQSVIDLNVIAAMTNEKQYEVVERLAKAGRSAVEKLIIKKKS